MTPRQRMLLLALGGAVVLLAAALVVASTTGDGDDGPSVAAREATTTSGADTTTTSSSTTTTTPTTTTGARAAATTVAPATTARPATTSAAAPVVMADGALLRPPPTSVSRSMEKGDCHTLGDAGFAVQGCGEADVPGERVVWLTETGPAGGWRAYVFRRVSGRSWRPVLEMVDDGAALVAETRVRVVDLSGGGGDEIAFGFRLHGSASVLAVDVVQGAGEVAFHRDLDHGAARVTVGELDDWSAVFGPGDQSCCPSTWRHSVIRFVGGAWRLVAVSTERTAPPPSHL